MKIFLAGKENDHALRDLARNTPFPGWVHLAFCREPDFFHGLAVEGNPGQVIAAIENNSLVGMGCRTVRSVYVNGQRSSIGYLSGLRILPSARRTTLLARGYHFLKKLHCQDGLVPAYLTTIIEGNKEARALLTSRRAGLPQYLDRGQVITYAIDTRRPCLPERRKDLTVKGGGQVPLEHLVEFLNREGARKQFFPVIRADDFGTARLRGLKPDDFLVACTAGGIAGVLASWDQNSFKQYMVCGYEPALSIGRPFLNLLLRATKGRALPAPGEQLKVVYASFACVYDDDPEVLSLLLDSVCRQTRESRAHFVLIGLHERDPLNKALEAFRTLKYMSRLYMVCWDDGLDFMKSVDVTRIPYLELATL
jgi:hypothetical protein